MPLEPEASVVKILLEAVFINRTGSIIKMPNLLFQREERKLTNPTLSKITRISNLRFNLFVWEVSEPISEQRNGRRRRKNKTQLRNMRRVSAVDRLSQEQEQAGAAHNSRKSFLLINNLKKKHLERKP
jgi:hypothetical protein